MRLKFAVPLALALAGLGTLGPTARPTHAAPACGPRTRAARRRVRYRICYRTVLEDRTCVQYRPVYSTVLKECRYTTCRPGVRAARPRTPLLASPNRSGRATTSSQKYTVCRPVYEQHLREQRYCVLQADGAGVPGAHPLDHLPPGLRAARARPARTPCASRWCRSTRCPSAGPPTARSTSSTCAPARTPCASRWCRSTRCPSAGPPTGPSTSSTCVPAPIRCASRCGRSTRCRCAGTTYRPVYEQHVRACPYTRFAGRCGRSTSARRWTTYRTLYEQHVREHRLHTVCKPVWQEYQVPVRGPPATRSTTSTSARCRRPATGPSSSRASACARRTPASRSPHPLLQGLHRLLAGGSATSAPARWSPRRAAARLPGALTRVPARRTYCPGPTVTYQVQCPGRWVCKRTWVPARGGPHRHLTAITSRRSTATSKPTTCAARCRTPSCARVPYTTCRMVTQEHCKLVTCRKCTWSPRSACSTFPTRPAASSPSSTGRMVTLPQLHHGPRAAGAVHPVHDVPHGARAALPHGDPAALLLRSRSSACSTSRTRPAGWCPSSTASW